MGFPLLDGIPSDAEAAGDAGPASSQFNGSDGQPAEVGGAMTGHKKGECSDTTPPCQADSSPQLYQGPEGVLVMTPLDFHVAAGHRLRKLIRMLGISQTEAGRIMGVTKHVVRNWCVGDNPISTYALYRLCRAKRVDFNYVFLGIWTELPYRIAAEVEAEATGGPKAAPARARREPEKNGA